MKRLVGLLAACGLFAVAAHSQTYTPPNQLFGGAVQTSSPTITTAACGTIVALGGSGFYSITLPSAAGFPAGCSIQFKNTDTGRGKGLSGFPSDFSAGNSVLWPLQAGAVQIVNGAWATAINPGVWQASGAVTINVNHASGTDVAGATDGLGTGAAAFATIQHAINVIQTQINSNNIGIQNAAETFTESVQYQGFNTSSGTPGISITGSPGTPDNTVWQVGASSTALLLRDLAISTVSGFKFVATGSGSTALSVSQGAVVDFKNIDFGTFTSGIHISISGNAAVNYDTGGSYTVSGNVGEHIFQNGPSFMFIPTVAVSVPNALTFTLWHQLQNNATAQYSSVTFTGTGSGAGSTGKQFSITGCANLILSGVTLPGATAGTPAAGTSLTTANCAGLTP